MLCCIAVAFLIGLVRQGWRSLTLAGEAGPSAPLPPAARRPQPGVPPAAGPVPPASPRGRWESEVLTRARVALELRFAAAGILLYGGALALLLAVGAADSGAAASGWVARDVLFAGLAVMALVVARYAAGSEPSPLGRERLACGLMGIGVVWLELGLLDMHVFGLFELADGALLWDAVFHGAGAAAFAAGWALLVTETGGRRQSWRQATA